MPSKTDETLKVLRDAVKGLTFESESSAPVKAFLWPTAEGTPGPLTADALREREKLAGDVAIAEAVGSEAVDDFFAPMAREQDWHGPDEKEAAARFRALTDLLKKDLSDLRVFRAGEIDIDAFVIGRTPRGDLAGVRTRLTET